MEGLAAGWPWLWCSPRGFAPEFGAALTGNKSVGLSQCRLQRGGGRTHLWVSATARSGREKSFRNTREKERCPQSPSSLFPLGQCWSLYCLLLGFILSTIPSVASPGLCSQPLSWGTGNCSACRCMGRSSDTCLGWELGARGGLSGTPRPRSPRGSHCSAGLSSSAKDLRVQSRQQELSHVKPRGYMEKQSETWWP